MKVFLVTITVSVQSLGVDALHWYQLWCTSLHPTPKLSLSKSQFTSMQRIYARGTALILTAFCVATLMPNTQSSKDITLQTNGAGNSNVDCEMHPLS